MLYATQKKGKKLLILLGAATPLMHHEKLMKLNLLCMLFIMALVTNLKAEGLLQIAPYASDDVALYVGVGENDGGNYGEFAWKDSPSRLFFHVMDPTSEVVYLGFSAPLKSRIFERARVDRALLYRILAPDGSVCLDWTNLDLGNINSRQAAINGPKPLGNPDGYIPIVFDPASSGCLQSGNYYIEFYKENRRSSEAFYIRYFDITVAGNNGTEAINGRVWSNNWALGVNADGPCLPDENSQHLFCRSFNGSFYVCSEEGYVTKVDFDNCSTFQGFRAGNFNVSFNRFGTMKTGDILEDRKSLNDESIDLDLFINDFLPVFLNDPDTNICPTGTFGRFQAQPDFLTQCRREGYCINVSASQIGQFEVLIDLNNNERYDGFPERLLAYQLVPADSMSNPADPAFPYETCIEWDGRDAEGTLLDTVSFSLFITYSQGAYHFPTFDVELNEDGFYVTNVRPADPSPVPIFWNDINIPGANGTGDPLEEFNGCFPREDTTCNISGCHTWRTFDYGNNNTINNWWFASRDAESFPNLILPRLAISCPPDLMISCVEDISPESLGYPEISGGCNEIFVSYVDEREDTDCPGRYTILRTWTAEDIGVEAASCVQTIQVEDLIDPVILQAPNDTIVSCGEEVPWPYIPVTDECTPNELLVRDSTETTNGGSGFADDPLIITRTWTISDLCGNSTSVSQQIRVEDCIDDCDIDTVIPLSAECSSEGNYILRFEVIGSGLRVDPENFKVIIDHHKRNVLSVEINEERTRAYIEVELPGNGTNDVVIFVQMAPMCNHTERRAYDEPNCGGYDCRLGRPVGTGNILLIYPNPSNGRFKLILNTEMDDAGDEASEIMIFNQIGQLVRKVDVIENHVKDMDLRDLPHGIYFIKTNGKYEIGTKRILIRE